MPRLEYRLLDEDGNYPVLYYYANIDYAEIAARFACDVFIKAGTVYERTSCAVELVCYVIYVQESGKNGLTTEAGQTEGKPVIIELRQDGESPSPGLLITTFAFDGGTEPVLYLQADYHYWLGEEWLKTRTVVDEDRKVYVCYMKPVAQEVC